MPEQKKVTIDDPEIFEILWTGFNFQNGEGYAGARLNQVVRILDALDEISEPVKPDIGLLRAALHNPAIENIPPQQLVAEFIRLASSMGTQRRLRPGGGELCLKNEDFAVLRQKLEQVPWVIAAAKKAKRTLDWLSMIGEGQT